MKINASKTDQVWVQSLDSRKFLMVIFHNLKYTQEKFDKPQKNDWDPELLKH
jgi:hypothetical protein